MNFWYQTNIMGQFWPLIRPEDIDWSFTSLLTLNFCLFVCLFVDWRRHSDSVPGICAYSSHSSTNRVLLFSAVAWRNSKNYQVGRWDRPSEINLQRKIGFYPKKNQSCQWECKSQKIFEIWQKQQCALYFCIKHVKLFIWIWRIICNILKNGETLNKQKNSYPIEFFLGVPNIFIVVLIHEIDIRMQFISRSRQNLATRHHF